MNTNRLNWLDWIAFALVIIGAINWGLVGFFSFDLVGVIFGGTFTIGARVIFAIVGLAGLWSIYALWKINNFLSVQVTPTEMEKRRAA